MISILYESCEPSIIRQDLSRKSIHSLQSLLCFFIRSGITKSRYQDTCYSPPCFGLTVITKSTDFIYNVESCLGISILPCCRVVSCHVMLIRQMTISFVLKLRRVFFLPHPRFFKMSTNNQPISDVNMFRMDSAIEPTYIFLTQTLQKLDWSCCCLKPPAWACRPWLQLENTKTNTGAINHQYQGFLIKSSTSSYHANISSME